MKISAQQKKILIVAGVAVVGVLIYRAMAKAAVAPVVIGNKTLVSPESTITIGPPTITPASKSWSTDFADSLGDLIAGGYSGSNSGMLK